MRISDWSSDVCSSDLKLKRDVRIGVSVIISSNEHPKSSIGEDELTTQVMHAPRPRVHLMGGDGGEWALDDDLAQTRAALAGAIEEADLGTADILHSVWRSEEHTSELQSLMRISYAVFCLKKKKRQT